MKSVGAQPNQDGPTWLKQIDADGSFHRRDAQFRQFVDPTGGRGPEPARGRYHLYVSLACPWAHRTLITRALKGLDQVISRDVVDHFLSHDGWTMQAKSEHATRDSVNGKRTLREVYRLAAPEYEGSVTVPVLWDKQTSSIVNNESSEIIRMFNASFQEFARQPEVDLYPEGRREEIDSVNTWVYSCLNDGVYKSGFARTQRAYEEAVVEVFDGLARAEAILSRQRYLAGDRLTEADVRLFPTLIRFDTVYHAHFKCSLRRLVDYPNLWGYTRELYSFPAFRETTNFEHIKKHYFASHETINPYRIVPLGPSLELEQHHDRGRFPVAWRPEGTVA